MKDAINNSADEKINGAFDKPRQLDKYVALFTAVLLFVVYGFFATDYPHLEDDGLFVLAGYFAGTAHSPGYPLFVLLSQPFLMLPFGTSALKVHLVSSACAATTAGLLYHICRQHLALSRIPSLTGVGCLAFSSLYWEQALIAEAYQLNCLLFVVMIWISQILRVRSVTASVNDNETGALVFAAGLLFGLSLSNHWPLTLLLAPVYLLIVTPSLVRLFGKTVFFVIGTCVGLLPYGWMYLTSSDDNFNHMGEFRSLNDFVYFVARGVYGDVDNQVQAGLADKLLFARSMVARFAVQYSPLVLPLILIGLASQWRLLPRTQALALTYSLLLPVILIVFLNFTYTPVEVTSMSAYLLPLYVVAAVWLAVALELLRRYLVNRSHARHSVIMMVVGSFLFTSVLYNQRAIILTNDFLTKDAVTKEAVADKSPWSEKYARFVLQQLPADAHLFVMGDWSMATISYLHLVDGVRPDVSLHSEFSTFLPERIVPYFGVSEPARLTRVISFMNAHSPVFVLQNPVRYGLPYLDVGYAYEMNPQSTDDLALRVERVRDFYRSLLSEVPADSWQILHYEALVQRFAAITPLYEEDPDWLGSNFWLNLIAAEQLMSAGSDFEVALAQRLLDMASLGSNEQTNFGLARLAVAKGNLMFMLGGYDAAGALYEYALDRVPVGHNRAVRALAALYVHTCQSARLHDLTLRFLRPEHLTAPSQAPSQSLLQAQADLKEKCG